MIFLSILAKTLALALGHLHPWLAGTCWLPRSLASCFCCDGYMHPWLAGAFWMAGAAADLHVARKAAGEAGSPKVLRSVILLNIAALVMGWAALGACDYAAIRWKEGIPVFASLVSWLLGLTGLSVGSNGGMVYLSTMAGPLEFATSIDGMGLKAPWLFAVLGGVWLFWAEATLAGALRKLGGIVAVLLAVVVVRMACFILLANSLFDFVSYDSEELPYRPFMSEVAGVWIYLPFLLGAGVLIGRWLAPPAQPAEAPAPFPRILLWAGVPLLLVLAGISCWEPQGKPKTGKIVICTYHTQWSRTDRPYDREWYGAESGYNYACMKRLFGLFQPVEEARDALTADSLKGASTLVIYDPDRIFSEDETEVIREFVRNGGGLFLIGDHTNVFGGTSHMNKVCGPFGFQFRDDVLFDLDEDFHQMMYPPRIPSPFWHGMSLFKLRGPTSITPTSWSTRCIYQVGHSKGVRAIYSVNNFYPPPHDDPKMKTGTFCVSAASHYGSGRVVAWADSTVFSNFEIYYPGKYEFLLNTVNWLNHQDEAFGSAVRRILPFVVLAGLVAFLARRREPRVWLATAAVALACFGVARAVCLWQEQRSADFPKPVQHSDWVVFGAHAKDQGYILCDFISNEPYDQRYDVFIQWVLRTGAYPGFHLLDKGSSNGLYDHLRASGDVQTALALIVRKPGDLAQLEELAAVRTRPTDPLLLMFASTISAEQAAEKLERSGLVKDAGALAKIPEAWPKGEVVFTDGQRRVMIVAGAERFSDKEMGITEKVVPDAGQRARFNQAFEIIDRLLGRVATGGK